ncbi:MAG TPA: ABC transporter ATP-binding protein [Gemmatimonadaceae bacterium]|nr:ABC transporter ATP-binding protein [Gemmatimonadaceae bacterium]
MKEATPSGALSLVGVTRRFPNHIAVDNLSLDVSPGELLALIGASGSGKTTTLRIIAGYELPDEGRVLLDGTDVTTQSPQRRNFGMVFQHYALFPHLSVGENVAFGLEARGVSKRDRMTRAANALSAVGLAHAEGRRVQSLSGGEQQRVALARALIIEPRVLLLDEPLSNLDPTLRRSTREELRATLRRQGATSVFVTHDQEDAFAVADRVALLERGRLLQVGTAEQLYDRPASRAVAEFIGRAALVRGTFDGQSVTIAVDGAAERFRAAPAAGVASGDVLAVLRPDALSFAPRDSEAGWPGEVVSRRFAGALIAYHVLLSGGIDVELHSTERGVQEGERARVRLTREPVAVVSP